MNRLRMNSLIVFTIFVITLFAGTLMIQAEDKAADNQDGKDKLVYVIPIEDEVERGLEAFLIRSTEEAIEEGANHIIFEIDTPGGRVDSATQIAKLLQGLQIPTTSFIVRSEERRVGKECRC